MLGNTVQKSFHDNIITATGPSASFGLRLYMNSSQYYSGNVIFSSITINTNKGDVVKGSMAFEGNGAISYN